MFPLPAAASSYCRTRGKRRTTAQNPHPGNPVGVTNPHRDRQPRLRGDSILLHGHWSEIVTSDLTLQLKVAIARNQLQTSLTDVNILQILRKLRRKGRIHVGSLGSVKSQNRNGLHLRIIDRGSIKLIGNRASRSQYRQK